MAHEVMPTWYGHGYEAYPRVAGRSVLGPDFKTMCFAFNDMVCCRLFPIIIVK